jgi:molecular chaperone DnaJ
VVNSSAHGDLYVEVAVEVPTKLSKEQRKLLEEFRSSLEGDDSHSPKTTGFFDGVKRFFGDL